MPFTFSHPAVVLPLAYLPKRWISLTGLVLGSIAPDFEKFAMMKLSSMYSHTWGSIFWFSLPVALLLSFVYHLVVRDIFIDHLPSFLKQRLYRYKRLNWLSYFKKNYIAVILSIIIGAASHLILDNFTHKYGAFVPLFPILQNKIYLNDLRLSLVRLLDLSCSFLGGLVIIYSLLSLPPEQVPDKPLRAKIFYWAVITIGTCLVFGLRIFIDINFKTVWDVGVSLISATLISFIVSSFLLRKPLSSKSF